MLFSALVIYFFNAKVSLSICLSRFHVKTAEPIRFSFPRSLNGYIETVRNHCDEQLTRSCGQQLVNERWVFTALFLSKKFSNEDRGSASIASDVDQQDGPMVWLKPQLAVDANNQGIFRSMR